MISQYYSLEWLENYYSRVSMKLKDIPWFTIARSGKVHSAHCFALTHDGPCDCPLVLGFSDLPRRRPLTITLGQAVPNGF